MQNRNPSRPTGFTLVELLIVITIISILAGMSMAALSGAAQEGKRMRARSQIAKLDQLISQKWNSYRYRQLPIRIPAGVSPYDAALIRLNAIRELMRMELPDRLSDITDGPRVLFAEMADADPNDGLPWDYNMNLYNGDARDAAAPAVTRAYRRKITPLAASRLSYENAEALYLIVSEIRDGDKSALEFFMNSEIGDVDGDGMYEILDPWGEPIMFLRWAPGHSRVAMTDEVKPGQPLFNFLTAPPAPVANISVSTVQVPAGQVAPDPFDPLKIDPRWSDPSFGFKPFLLRPLIVSGGPDKVIDLYNDFGSHYALPPAPSPASTPNDPYARNLADNVWIGTPYDADGNGLIQNGDNITNHGLELEGE
jgi:prepilin-type N-terminal cleavage/methylation domain-containing protein